MLKGVNSLSGFFVNFVIYVYSPRHTDQSTTVKPEDVTLRCNHIAIVIVKETGRNNILIINKCKKRL